MNKSKAFKAIIFIVVLLIPLIYSFFYLKSYWNPYGNLSDMKIAVVNLDEGQDDKNQGKEFVQSLKDSGTFKILEVNQEEADEGMKNGSYYATIKIPENFTKCLESASTEQKQIAQITYCPNQATNYLATQIVNSAVKTIELSLQSKVDKEIIANLASKLNEVPDSLQEISDGADQILTGAESLNSGISQINDGTNTLNNSYTEFDNGVKSAYTGSQSLENGIAKVQDGIGTLKQGGNSLDSAISQINQGADELSSKGSQGITSLAEGVNSLNDGAKNLNSGVEQYVDGTTSLAKGTTDYITNNEKLISGTEQYVEGVETLNQSTKGLLEAIASQEGASDPTLDAYAKKAKQILQTKKNGVEIFTYIQKSGETLTQSGKQISKYNETLKQGSTNLINTGATLKAGSNSLYLGTQNLLNGTKELGSITNGIQSLKTALVQVKQGTTTLNTGIETLSNGTKELSTGSNSLTEGLKKLSTSSNTVENALDTLSNGTNEAYEGSSKLVSGVETFKTTIDEGLENTKEELKVLDGIDTFGEDPVEFKTEEYGKVDSYGIAFTPLFLCIGLWVGALMAYVVLYYDHDERFGIFGISTKNKLLQNLLYIALGAIEGLFTAILLKIGLGYEIQNMALYYGASILIGITFMSIIQFLIRNFGDIGKFLALIILVLQLAAAGGTFPVETIDKGFQSISPYLPMTYSIKLLREILVPTASNYKGKYIAILLGITIGTMVITFVVDILKKKKEESKT